MIIKHLGMVLDFRLDFKEHLAIVFKKVSKVIALLRKLPNLLPRKYLITVYKFFIRPHLDYGDIISDQDYNVSFLRKLESIQCNAAKQVHHEGLQMENSNINKGFSNSFFYADKKNFELVVPKQGVRYTIKNLKKNIPQFRTNHA